MEVLPRVQEFSRDAYESWRLHVVSVLRVALLYDTIKDCERGIV